MKMMVTLSAQEVEDIVLAYIKKKFPNKTVTNFQLDAGPATADVTEVLHPRHDIKE